MNKQKLSELTIVMEKLSKLQQLPPSQKKDVAIVAFMGKLTQYSVQNKWPRKLRRLLENCLVGNRDIDTLLRYLKAGQTRGWQDRLIVKDNLFREGVN